MNSCNFGYITIFPDYFHNYFSLSIPYKAIKKSIISYSIFNPRDYSINRKVDDYLYGGGDGMLLKIEPIVMAINKIKQELNAPYFVLLSPQGKIFSQSDVKRYIQKKNLVFICGHYEGIDARIENYIDEKISLGKFVSLGGEIPSLLITDSLIRGIPGVIKENSYNLESYQTNNPFLFDFDSYTRPKEFEGFKVPDVLLSGNHKKISDWRINNMKNKHYLLKNKLK